MRAPHATHEGRVGRSAAVGPSPRDAGKRVEMDTRNLRDVCPSPRYAGERVRVRGAFHSPGR